MDDSPTGRLRLSRLTFRAKITGLSLAATLGAVVIAVTVFVLQAWFADRDNLAGARIALAESAASRAGPALDQGRPELAAQALDQFRGVDDLYEATFYTVEGRPFLHWGRGAAGGPLEFVSLAKSSAAYRDGELQIHTPIMSGDRHVGELVLISGDLRVRQDMMRVAAVAAAMVVGALAIAGLLAHWLSGRVLQPLTRLAAGMEQVRSTKDFTVFVEPTSSDEFGWLTVTFNTLLEELKANDAALRQARDAADAANVMKSQFLANMSHEIRTPMNGVLGMAQAMAMYPLDAEQKERLDVIRRSGESLLAILNDLLDLSKIEAGKLELEDADFDLEELASGAHAAFASVATGKGIGFELDIDESARGVWRGDSVRVRQVLYNLISNALKFTTSGAVRVRIAGVSTDQSPALSLSVSDTGIGIAPDKLATLFDKFVQADSTTTRRFGGTGLGLSICRELAQLMGGEIRVESVMDRGSTFEAVLPMPWISPPVAAEARAEEAPVVHDTDTAPLRVLAAEDNETNQLVLRTILATFGIDCVMVENGREAVERWNDGGFDLILMDVQMPVLDGVAATREIRALEHQRAMRPTPIVALSANAMKHQVDEYLGAGMDAHLAKPLQLDKLTAILAAYAERRSQEACEAAA